MISVIIATYNGEKYIQKQLQSILNQRKQPDEVIIRDDCSTDNTGNLIKEFIKENELSNWSFETNVSNKGYRGNFNNLLSLVNGDYIFLSDQDDEWLPNKIEKMVSIFENNQHILALNGSISLIDGHSHSIEIIDGKNMYNSNFYFSVKKLKRLNQIPLSDLVISNVTPGCAMAITKNLKEMFLQSYNEMIPHDWYLNMIAAIKGGCYYLNEPVINYRVHSNNAIGLSSAAERGLKAKLKSFDKEERIKNFQMQIDAIDKLTIDFANVDIKTKESQNYLKTRVAFYKKSTFMNLLKMCKYKDYQERTAIRGRIWDLVLALKIDSLAYLLDRRA
ncbi:glycosyltransferase family 2 protein [Ligilactobacillus sp. WILCCON 0076]|uniref:Glycosyltransferase family 2 protein n=1 Tax=Ligilactobacillus ubinensis TaxID=2876789 RepID=A0A9X2JM74_9LACO|nr:glycosyltransferase family 2 protein [Ligilactobacillus ubinensis]MCP0887609.1 glycosyltransferase family 2 protein [Ligilactobacillus ubinensis]